jgi:hypothetical protein
MSDRVTLAHRPRHARLAAVATEPEMRLTTSGNDGTHGRHWQQPSVYTLRVKPHRRCQTQPFTRGQRRQGSQVR